jgi:spore maturation protein CgeB
VFDPALAGAFQVTEARPDLPELLVPEKEIVTADSPLELKDKLAFYRDRPEARARIAAAGAARVAAEHTFRHRIARLLAVVGAKGAQD